MLIIKFTFWIYCRLHGTLIAHCSLPSFFPHQILITVCVYLTHGVKISIVDCCGSNYTFLNAFNEPIISYQNNVSFLVAKSLKTEKEHILQLVGWLSFIYWNVTFYICYIWLFNFCLNYGYVPIKWYALKLGSHLEAYDLPPNYYLTTFLVTFHY